MNCDCAWGEGLAVFFSASSLLQLVLDVEREERRVGGGCEGGRVASDSPKSNLYRDAMSSSRSYLFAKQQC